MSGRVLRSACTAALATLTVLTAVPSASYAASYAAAEPGGDTAIGGSAAPAPSPVPPAVAAPEQGLGTAAAEALTDADAQAGAGGDVGSPPGGVSGMLTRLQLLYRQTEEATEAYNATEVELTRKRAETTRLDSGLARARTALARSRSDIGRLAREQYQGQSDLSDYLRLLLSRDPRHALDGGYLLDRAARSRVETMARLKGGEKHAGALAAASRKALDQQQALATKQKKQRDAVRSGLREVGKLLASLSSEEIASLAALEKSATDRAQRDLLASGALGEGTPGPAGPDGAPGSAGYPGARGAAGDAAAARRTPSAQGQEALAFAAAQIGKPYEWGAEGPGSYDCSGLTSQAWSHAGRAVPRTSQEQWRTLPRVPLRELRPGDLVVYFPKATHVAIYLGDGTVIQAPRPGARVKVSPIAANPLLGAVRPDPDAAALAPAAYRPPTLPAGATDGSDEGYGDDGAPVGGSG